MDRQPLDKAVEAFMADRDARIDGLVARRDLKKAIVMANAAGWSDQQLATAFKRVEEEVTDDHSLSLSRARVQQLRTGDK